MQIFAFLYKMAESGDRKIYSDFPTSFKTNSLFLVASNYLFISNFILILFFFFCKFSDSCNRYKVIFSFLWLHAPLFTFLFNRYFSGRLRGVVSMADS